MLAGNNFTENFTADVPLGILISTAVSAAFPHTFISRCVTFLNNKLKNINDIPKITLTRNCKIVDLSNLPNGSQRQVQISKELCIQ